MMKKSIYREYKEDIDEALNFLDKEKQNLNLRFFIIKMKNDYASASHAQRWSLVYDFISEKYPQYKMGGIITGLSYALEIFGQNDLLEGKICQKIKEQF